MLIESTSRRKASAWSAPSSPARAMNARMSFGQAAAAEAEAGVEELPADPGVVADRVGQLRDVGAGRLAQLGHRVDERDLGGQERVGGGLDQLGRGVVGDDQRRRRRPTIARVDLVEQRRAPSSPSSPVGQAVDQPVGVQGVLRRRSPRAGTPGSRPASRRAPSRRPARRAARRCRPARWTSRRPGRRAADVAAAPRPRRRRSARSAAYSPRFCGVPTQTKWTCASGGVGDVGGERQPARRQRCGQQLVEARLVERRLAALAAPRSWAASTSMPTTSCPSWAMHAACTAPR